MVQKLQSVSLMPLRGHRALLVVAARVETDDLKSHPALKEQLQHRLMQNRHHLSIGREEENFKETSPCHRLFVFGHVPPRPGNESREHANESMRTPANKFVQLETCGGQSRCQWALLWSELAAAHFSLGDPQSARHVLSAALVEWPQCVALHREMATVLLSLGSDMQSERDQVLQHVEWTLHQQMQQVRRKNDTGLSASHSTTGRQDLSNFDLLSPWPGPSPDPPSVTAGGASATKHLLPVHAVLSSVCGPETIGSRGVQSVPASVVDLLIAAGGDTDVAILAVVLGVQRGLAALSATTPPNSKEQWTPVGEPREPLTMETGILHDTIIADRVIHDELQRAPESAATIIREVTNGPRQLRPRPPSTLSTPTPESSRNQSLRHFTKEWIEYVVSHSYDDICVWLSDGLCSRAENAAGAPSSELWESPSFWTTGLPSRCVGNSSFVGVLNEPLLQIAELARLRGHWLVSCAASWCPIVVCHIDVCCVPFLFDFLVEGIGKLLFASVG